jgi:hypothetical protein
LPALVAGGLADACGGERACWNAVGQRLAMDRMDIVRKLIVNGSDDLVQALYERLCADRVAEAPGTRARPGGGRAKTWLELAGLAVAESVLTPEEARRLLEPELKQLRLPSVP